MADTPWLAENEHPAPDILLLHLEGELDARAAAAVERHLRDCWTCRAQCERMQQGIRAFVDYQEVAEVPAPPAGRHGFLRRLREEAAVPGAVRRGPWRWGMLAAGGMAAAVLIVLLLPARSVSAAQLLERATRAAAVDRGLAPRQRVIEKIRIRRGNRVVRSSLSRGPGLQSTSSTPPEPEMQQALAVARIDWQDPLNVNDFTAWRESQHGARDRVERESGAWVLTTEAGGGSAVRRASLTVDQASWRAIARHVDFRDQPPVEVVMESREVVEEPAVLPEPAAGPMVSRAAVEPAAVPGAPAALPGMRELDRAELELRERFHELSADVREAPEIWQSDGVVRFRLFAESPVRREEILGSVRRIPLVQESKSGPPGGRVEPDEAPAPRGGPAHPPFEQKLRDHFGGQDQANWYLDQVGEVHARLTAEATALERLARRYPQEVVRALPPDEQERLERLVRDHVAKVSAAGREYARLAWPILDLLSAAGADGAAAASGCDAWQEAAARIPADQRRLHRGFTRLFIRDESPGTGEDSVAALLAEAGRSRELWQRHLGALCSPGQ